MATRLLVGHVPNLEQRVELMLVDSIVSAMRDATGAADDWLIGEGLDTLKEIRSRWRDCVRLTVPDGATPRRRWLARYRKFYKCRAAKRAREAREMEQKP